PVCVCRGVSVLVARLTRPAGADPLSLHDALPILAAALELGQRHLASQLQRGDALADPAAAGRYFAQRLRGQPREVFAALYLDARSEEHTSELQSREKLVCRLLLEKKNGLLSRTAT